MSSSPQAISPPAARALETAASTVPGNDLIAVQVSTVSARGAAVRSDNVVEASRAVDDIVVSGIPACAWAVWGVGWCIVAFFDDFGEHFYESTIGLEGSLVS